jgi:hypothetical protein
VRYHLGGRLKVDVEVKRRVGGESAPTTGPEGVARRM